MNAFRFLNQTIRDLVSIIEIRITSATVYDEKRLSLMRGSNPRPLD